MTTQTSHDEFSKNSRVWVPAQEEGWLPGTIIEVTSDQSARILLDNENEATFPVSQLFLQNPSILEGVDDMTTLSYLHEPAILHNLSTRYSINIIYTYTGSILIAVNPYQKLNMYSKDMIEAYCGQPLGRLAPHVYAMAEEAYRSMVNESTNQSILVSGESGAGKTETTKFLLQYFTAMGQREKNRSGSKSKDSDNIETRVLESTPVLEAFGNAKTLRNDNSSRFGKFIEVQFDSSGIVIGAKIRTYLLERSRLVRQAVGERSYHAFYQLCRGASQEEREKYKILSPEDYFYLNQSECTTIEEVSDEEQYQRTREAMSIVGISSAEQDQIFLLISAILHLGNVQFQDGEQTDSCKITNKEDLLTTASLLGCDADTLEKYLITKKVVAGTDSYFSPLTPEQACASRDALSMLLYSRMFDWLVKRINVSTQSKQTAKSFIGVLDIYGFESFDVNSFEQFCINYANEKLQQQFNQQIFKLEQKEYEKEKIDWSYIKFNDNQECLDLIEKKPICILTLLDEECKFPKATGATFSQKLYNNFNKNAKPHAYFDKPRFSNTQFTVKHYAGPVTYNTDSFLDKNKDYIVPEHISMLEKSSVSYIKTLFEKFWDSQGNAKPGAKTESKSGVQFVSVGSQFRDSLTSLMESIYATSPHYIRCIKPNHSKKPNEFSQLLVLQQLRCGGVLECIRISKAGYPTRRLYDGFLKRYKLLAPKLVSKDNKMKPKEYCEALIKSLGGDPDGYQFGLSKIFLRAGLLAKFEKMRTDLMTSSAIKIQKMYKGLLARKRYAKQKECAIRLQSIVRMVNASRLAVRIRRNNAAIRIQKNWRMHRERKQYTKKKNAALVLQSVVRRGFAVKEMKGLKRGVFASVVQAAVRGMVQRKFMAMLRKATLIVQKRWRGKMARKVYTELRIEARSLRTVLAQKNEIEMKFEEIQWKFQAEIKIRNKMEEDIRKLNAQISDAKSNCILESHANLEIDNKKLKSELEQIKDKLKKEEEKRKELEVKIAEDKKKSESSEKVLKDTLERKADTLLIEVSEYRAKYEKQQEEVKKQESRHQFELQQLREKLQEQEKKFNQEQEKWKIQVEESKRANADLMQQLDSLQLEESPAWILRKTAIKLIGSESNGLKFLIDFANSKVLSNLLEQPESAYISGIPVPAFITLRTLLRPQSNSLDSGLLLHILEATNVMTRNYKNDMPTISFWLSNTAVLLYVLSEDKKSPIEIQNIVIGLKAFDGLTGAQDPMQHLKFLFVRIYCMVLDTIYRVLKPMAMSALEQGDLGMKHMKHMVSYLSGLLSTFQQYFVPVKLVRLIYKQIFMYLDAAFFNEIILRRDLCTWSQGMELKMKVSLLDDFARKPGTRDWTSSTTERMETVRELISLMTLMDKSILTNKQVRQEICPKLTAVQIKQLLSMYQPDESLEEPIPLGLIKTIFKAEDFNFEDPLCLDSNSLQSLPFTEIHYLSMSDVKNIPFPISLQKEFEDTTRSPQSSPAVDRSSPPGLSNNHRASLPDDIGGLKKKVEVMEVPTLVVPSEDQYGTIPPGRNRSKSTDEKKKGFFSFFKSKE